MATAGTALNNLPWKAMGELIERMNDQIAAVQGRADDLGLFWLKIDDGMPCCPAQRVPDEFARKMPLRDNMVHLYQVFGTGEYVCNDDLLKTCRPVDESLPIVAFSKGWKIVYDELQRQQGQGDSIFLKLLKFATFQACALVMKGTIPRLWFNSDGNYVKIVRNHYTKQAKLMDMDQVDSCRCPQRGQMCVDSTCENLAMNYTCDPRKCSTECMNRPLHMRPVPELSVFKTRYCGMGLRVLNPLRKGDFIIEYVGEVINDKELKRRLDSAKDDNFYIMQLKQGHYIDAKKMGNLSRYINSSCDPNCELQKWTDAQTGETQIGIFALKDISMNDELTFNYNFKQYGGVSFQCRCGSKNCAGTLDKTRSDSDKSSHSDDDGISLLEENNTIVKRGRGRPPKKQPTMNKTDDLTEYERQREEKILRNQEMMKKLKLLGSNLSNLINAPTSDKKRKYQKKNRTTSSLPSREKSIRVKNAPKPCYNEIDIEQQRLIDEEAYERCAVYKTQMLTKDYLPYPGHPHLYLCTIRRPGRGRPDHYWKLFDSNGQSYPFENCDTKGDFKSGVNQTTLRSTLSVSRWISCNSAEQQNRT